jgi:hypothetical protein
MGHDAEGRSSAFEAAQTSSWSRCACNVFSIDWPANGHPCSLLPAADLFIPNIHQNLTALFNLGVGCFASRIDEGCNREQAVMI